MLDKYIAEDVTSCYPISVEHLFISLNLIEITSNVFTNVLVYNILFVLVIYIDCI